MKINNNSVYVQNMRKTIINKLFWVNEIFEPVSSLIDVGCADGALLNTYRTISPNTKLIGVDNNEEMLEMVSPGIETFSSLSDVKKLKGCSVINLSSVLHELYSYNNEKDINKFWDDILALDAQYITIRDMYVHSAYYCSSHYCGIYRNLILQSKFASQLKEFEEVWGRVTVFKNLVHFLLKYNYKENWDRELRENYLSWDFSDIKKTLSGKYQVIYYQTEELSYLAHKTAEDFGHSIDVPTHINIIFKKI